MQTELDGKNSVTNFMHVHVGINHKIGMNEHGYIEAVSSTQN